MSLDVDLICPHCGRSAYDANITHNLTEMASAAGIYGIVWHPEDNAITTASQLIEPLRVAIADMKARREHYEQFNSPNGWGLYKNFLPWLEDYLLACESHPTLKPRTSV